VAGTNYLGKEQRSRRASNSPGSTHLIASGGPYFSSAWTSINGMASGADQPTMDGMGGGDAESSEGR
jgi:hypothetical protein